MRFSLHRTLKDPKGKSLFGTFTGVGNPFRSQSLEREWLNNQAGASCVPDGFYVLEPHDGPKYKTTFALIGETVSHIPTRNIDRYACVFHWASRGSGLKGCISLAKTFLHEIDEPVRLMQDQALAEFKTLLRATPETHYLIITTQPGL